MNDEIIKIKIWGRELPIKIIYDCFEGEEITEIQKETLSDFFEHKDAILDSAYEKLKQFCLYEYTEYYDLFSENVFKVAKPNALYIKRSITKKHVIGLLCAFRPYEEHGLAIYIEDCKPVKIGHQDIIL